MARKHFTPDEVAILNQNPNTASATVTTLRFTLEFKEFFLKEMQAGKTTKQIVTMAGYDPALLGSSRLDLLRKNVRKEAESPEGLKPPVGLTNEMRAELFAQQELTKLNNEEAIKVLQNQIATLEEKIEFLSKAFF